MHLTYSHLSRHSKLARACPMRVLAPNRRLAHKDRPRGHSGVRSGPAQPLLPVSAQCDTTRACHRARDRQCTSAAGRASVAALCAASAGEKRRAPPTRSHSATARRSPHVLRSRAATLLPALCACLAGSCPYGLIIEPEWIATLEVKAVPQLTVVENLQNRATQIDVDAHAHQIGREGPERLLADGDRAVAAYQAGLPSLPHELFALRFGQRRSRLPQQL